MVNLVHGLLFAPVFDRFLDLPSYFLKSLLVKRLFDTFSGTLGAIDRVQTGNEQLNHVSHHLFIFDDKIYIPIAQLERQTLPCVEWFFT